MPTPENLITFQYRPERDRNHRLRSSTSTV